MGGYFTSRPSSGSSVGSMVKMCDFVEELSNGGVSSFDSVNLQKKIGQEFDHGLALVFSGVIPNFRAAPPPTALHPSCGRRHGSRLNIDVNCQRDLLRILHKVFTSTSAFLVQYFADPKIQSLTYLPHCMLKLNLLHIPPHLRLNLCFATLSIHPTLSHSSLQINLSYNMHLMSPQPQASLCTTGLGQLGSPNFKKFIRPRVSQKRVPASSRLSTPPPRQQHHINTFTVSIAHLHRKFCGQHR